MAGWAGGQDLRKEIRSFVTRGVPDSAGKVEEEINWAEVDDLAPEWDRVESGIDDLLSLSTTYWEPGLGPRAPRKAAGGWVAVEPVPGEEEGGGKVVLIARGWARVGEKYVCI